MTPEQATEAAGAAYEVAEANYLRLVSSDASRPALSTAAHAVAQAASSWQSAEDAHLASLDTSQRPPFQARYDVTEVLSDLWADIARAHDA